MFFLVGRVDAKGRWYPREDFPPCFCEGDAVLAEEIAGRVARDLTVLTEERHQARGFSLDAPYVEGGV